jgi:hypothetical protein
MKALSPYNKFVKKHLASANRSTGSPTRAMKKVGKMWQAHKSGSHSPTRRSPGRRSATRRSPGRRSATRRSPGRRSATRRSPGRRSASRRSAGRR